LRAGDLVGGRYRIERRLGGGGMALVYAARDEDLDRPVALKVLADNLAAQDDIRERFVREASIAASLSHPNIVEVYDSGEDGRPYIVMEQVDGPTLAQELEAGGRMAPSRAAALAAQAADGLAHAHAAGVVHRDVKPGNLLLAGGTTLKIADFGIAYAVESTRLTQTGTVLGTASYLAPEQARGEPATPAADVYALGAVLYELLTGRPARTASTLTELIGSATDDPVPGPRAFEPSVPPELDVLVERCLAAEPRVRPQAAEVRDALRGESEALTELTRPPPPKTRLRAARSGNRRAWLAVLLAALVLGGTALGLAASLGGTSGPRQPAPPRVSDVPAGATPAQQARNLARWLRRYSR
jgi:serine/threonine protein kinase